MWSHSNIESRRTDLLVKLCYTFNSFKSYLKRMKATVSVDYILER